jgi:hypothetical protein
MDGPFSFRGLAKIFGAFILVIALLLIFLKLLGRLSRGRNKSDGKGFILRATMSLDSRRYLAAVELDGRLLVVAIAGDRVTRIAHWPVDESAPEPASGFHPGTLGLVEPDYDDGDSGEGPGPVFETEPGGRRASVLEKPVPRPGVREPAFLRGETEDGYGRDTGEAEGPVDGGVAGPERAPGFNLGIDEEGYDGPQSDEELRVMGPGALAGPAAAPGEGPGPAEDLSGLDSFDNLDSLDDRDPSGGPQGPRGR